MITEFQALVIQDMANFHGPIKLTVLKDFILVESLEQYVRLYKDGSVEWRRGKRYWRLTRNEKGMLSVDGEAPEWLDTLYWRWLTE